MVCVAGSKSHVLVYGYPAGLDDHRTKIPVATEGLLAVGFVRAAVMAGRHESHGVGKGPFVGEPVHVPHLSQYTHRHMLADAGNRHEQFKAVFVPFRLAELAQFSGSLQQSPTYHFYLTYQQIQ